MKKITLFFAISYSKDCLQTIFAWLIHILLLWPNTKALLFRSSPFSIHFNQINHWKREMQKRN